MAPSDVEGAIHAAVLAALGAACVPAAPKFDKAPGEKKERLKREEKTSRAVRRSHAHGTMRVAAARGVDAEQNNKRKQ